MHSDLKRDVQKLNESHRKETESLMKEKINLEEELRTATLENKNKQDEKATMSGLLECLQQFLSKQKAQVSEQTRDIKCKQCDFIANDEASLQTHIQDTHVLVYYPCEVCDEQFRDKQALKEHRLVHARKYRCEQCL